MSSTAVLSIYLEKAKISGLRFFLISQQRPICHLE